MTSLMPKYHAPSTVEELTALLAVEQDPAVLSGGTVPSRGSARCSRSKASSFCGQRLDDAGFITFLRRLGPLTFTAGERPFPGSRT